MSKIIKLIILLIIVIVIVFVIKDAGRFLVVNQQPEKSDVIIILAGDKGKRTEYGVKLFKEGYSKEIIVSGGILYYETTSAELMKNHAVKLGVPAGNIILEDKADSTYENAVFSKSIMDKYNFKSAIIVTSNYHTRRSKMIFDKVFENSNISLTYCASEDENFTPDKWWSNNKSMMIVINEYIKFIGYWFGKNS